MTAVQDDVSDVRNELDPENLLDEALEETFPASDPISPGTGLRNPASQDDTAVSMPPSRGNESERTSVRAEEKRAGRLVQLEKQLARLQQMPKDDRLAGKLIQTLRSEQRMLRGAYDWPK